MIQHVLSCFILSWSVSLTLSKVQLSPWDKHGQMVINDKFTYCGGSGFCDCRSLLDPWTMTLNCKSYKALQKIFFNVSRHVSRYLSRHVSHDFSRFPVHAGTVQERLQTLPGNRNVQILGVPKWWKSNESKWDHLVKKRIERFRLQNQFNMSRTHCSKHQDTFLIQSQVWTRKPKIEIKHWQKAEQQSATYVGRTPEVPFLE